MRFLVLSDIHANLEALEAVLADPPARACDWVLCLGDLVGYGADPNAVVDRVRALNPMAIVRGNHDKVAAGLEASDGFNPVAEKAAHWTAEALTPENLRYLAAIPPGPIEVGEHIEVCHGAPFDEDVYIISERHAARALRAAVRPLCLFGHTHLPLALRGDGERFHLIGRGSSLTGPIELTPSYRYLVNPGSVGQPRDGDPRAAYAVVDLEARVITLYRVAYPVEEARAKVLAAGLPPALADRLVLGR